MAVVRHDADFDLNGSALVRARLNPVTADPTSPTDGEVWYRTDTDQYRGRRNGVSDSFAMMSDVTAGGVSASLWDAQSVVVAVTDNTPIAQALASSTVLGRRATGDITAVTYAQLKSDLGLNNVQNVDTVQRANHTGTQPSSTISDFNTAVDARAQAIVDSLVAGAPGALDTLNELAAAINDDANFAATVTTALNARAKGFAANCGNGTQTQTIAHNLGTTDVTVEVFVIATGVTELCQVTRVDANNVKLDWNSSPALDTRRVVIVAKF